MAVSSKEKWRFKPPRPGPPATLGIQQANWIGRRGPLGDICLNVDAEHYRTSEARRLGDIKLLRLSRLLAEQDPSGPRRLSVDEIASRQREESLGSGSKGGYVFLYGDLSLTDISDAFFDDKSYGVCVVGAWRETEVIHMLEARTSVMGLVDASGKRGQPPRCRPFALETTLSLGDNMSETLAMES